METCSAMASSRVLCSVSFVIFSLSAKCDFCIWNEADPQITKGAKIDCLSFVMCPLLAQLKIGFFSFFLLWLFTVLMKQTRQALSSLYSQMSMGRSYQTPMLENQQLKLPKVSNFRCCGHDQCCWSCFLSFFLQVPLDLEKMRKVLYHLLLPLT